MKKPTKRLTALLMAGMLCLGLVAGCGKDGDSKGKKSSGTKDTLVVATMAETPTLSQWSTMPLRVII